MTERQTKAMKKLKRLLQRPRTMTHLVDKLGVSDRTVYRYLDALADCGTTVARKGTGYPVKFLIH